MKAAFVDALGPADGIRYGDLPVPDVRDNDVLVRVEAVTANHVDTFVRSGRFATDVSFPLILSRDLVGTIETVGATVSGFALGDRVWSNSLGHAGRQGAAAEFAVVPADRLYLLPDGVDPIDAVAVLHPAATAYLALHVHAKLRAADRVFVGGAAGQVGSSLVAQSRRAGGRVTASASGKDAEYCRQLGADTVLNYRSSQFAEEVAGAAGDGFDVYIETSGHHDLRLATANLKTAGRIILLAGVSASTDLPVGDLYTKDGSVLGFVISNAGVVDLAAAASRINELLVIGAIRARHIDVLPLSQMADAHRMLEAGQVRGTRLILVPDRIRAQSASRERDVGAERECLGAPGSGSPTPYQRSLGTSVARQSANQTSRAGTPSASARSAVRSANSPSTRSPVRTRPYAAPNSSAMACQNSLNRMIQRYLPS